MTDLQELPGPRCGKYVDATHVSYPCWLPQGHDGPCVAQEVPVSQVRRDMWLEQGAKVHQGEVDDQNPSAPLRVPTSGIPSPPAALNPAVLADPVEREKAHLASFQGKDFQDLPEWVKSAIIASSSQTSLAILWALCQQEFEQGAKTVTISPEFLNRLMTPAVRNFVSFFRFKE